MSEAASRASRVRRSAGWFDRPDRGLIRVTGGDRVRWTNGMLSNDVARLAPDDPTRSGCYALLLTPKGRIVADLHVLCREEAFWLEVAREGLSEAIAALDRYRIADDVALEDASDAWRRGSLEGPRAGEILARAVGAPVPLAPECGVPVTIAGAPAIVSAWGWSGESAYQLFTPADAAASVRAAILAAGEGELEVGDLAALEVLRIEAGTPRLGVELGLDVLPAEAGLIDVAVSLSKGCYTGQEIVARMESRGAAAHRLVGLRFDDSGALEGGTAAPGVSLLAGGDRVGEITSACVSAEAGPIALGYVRRAHAGPGTALTTGGARARVVPLPFVAAAA